MTVPISNASKVLVPGGKASRFQFSSSSFSISRRGGSSELTPLRAILYRTGTFKRSRPSVVKLVQLKTEMASLGVMSHKVSYALVLGNLHKYAVTALSRLLFWRLYPPTALYGVNWRPWLRRKPVRARLLYKYQFLCGLESLVRSILLT